MKAVVIRLIGLIRQYKKGYLLSSIRLKLSDLPHKAIRSISYSPGVGIVSRLKKNAVKRQTVNCPNTKMKEIGYEYTEPTVQRKIDGYKESFGVFGITNLYSSENLL